MSEGLRHIADKNSQNRYAHMPEDSGSLHVIRGTLGIAVPEMIARNRQDACHHSSQASHQMASGDLEH